MRIELNEDEMDEAMFCAARRKANLPEGTFIYEVSWETEVDRPSAKVTLKAFVEIEAASELSSVA